MTKSEFVDQVASESGLSKGEATKAVEASLKVIEDTLKRGGEINFTGFGKFSVADRGARQGVNPQTGERIQSAASRVPKFSAGSALTTCAGPERRSYWATPITCTSGRVKRSSSRWVASIGLPPGTGRC